jgi:hypothetical protein
MNFIIPSLVASIFYIIFKVIDMKYISKEELPLKTIVKDGIIVFVCGIIATLALEQLNNYNIFLYDSQINNMTYNLQKLLVTMKVGYDAEVNKKEPRGIHVKTMDGNYTNILNINEIKNNINNNLKNINREFTKELFLSIFVDLKTLRTYYVKKNKFYLFGDHPYYENNFNNIFNNNIIKVNKNMKYILGTK